MEKYTENPYLPGIEPEEVSQESTETASSDVVAESGEHTEVAAFEPEPITVNLIRTLVINHGRGVSRPKQLGLIDVYPNRDDRNRIVFGRWQEASDGTVKFFALEPDEQEVAQKIADDDEITGYRNGQFWYINNDSHPYK